MTERIVVLLFLLWSLIYVFLARELSFGTLGAPKAGFLPMISGVAATMLSCAAILTDVFRRPAEEADQVNWRKCIFLIAGLFFFVIVLNVAGYLVATFVVMFYWLKVTETMGWLLPCSISAGAAAVLYLVFENWLGVNLP
jgi:putative tricarboxylic transport membrane protein